MELRPFSLKQRKNFEHHLQAEAHELSGYSFVNVFIWRCLYDIAWGQNGGAFCLFFRDKAGCFMPLPPLGDLSEAVLRECFDTMDASRGRPDLSRIENIEPRDAGFFKKCGWAVYEKCCDYFVSRESIALLRGVRLKHRRNLYNVFTKNYKGVFRDYRPQDRRAVEALFRRWKKERLARYQDPFYKGMLDDNGLAFGELLDILATAGVQAKVVEIDRAVVAFTSGDPISKNVFCVNYEIVDHAFKGLAQYIFTSFARTLDAREINIMDDSGIESLKKTKLLLGDVRRVTSFTAIRMKQ